MQRTIRRVYQVVHQEFARTDHLEKIVSPFPPRLSDGFEHPFRRIFGAQVGFSALMKQNGETDDIMEALYEVPPPEMPKPPIEVPFKSDKPERSSLFRLNSLSMERKAVAEPKQRASENPSTGDMALTALGVDFKAGQKKEMRSVYNARSLENDPFFDL